MKTCLRSSLAIAALCLAWLPVAAQTVTPRVEDLVREFEAQRHAAPAVRIGVLKRFAEMKTEASAECVARIYKVEGDVAVGQAALGVLGEIGVVSAREFLVVEAKGASVEALRVSATVALVALRPPVACEVFVGLIGPSNPHSVRVQSARGLAVHGTKPAVDALIGVLVAPGKGKVPTTVVSLNEAALSALGGLRGKTPGKVIVERVLEQPEGKMLWHKRMLAPISGKVHVLCQLTDLVIALSRERDAELRAYCAGLFGHMKLSESTRERLVELLDDKDDDVASAAARSLGHYAPTEAFAALVKLAKGKGLRAAAATAALGGYPAANEAFEWLKVAALKKKPWQLAAAAMAALADMHRSRCIPILLEAFEKHEGRLRADARDALARLSGEDFGSEPAEWREWWRAVGDHFKLPPKGAAPKASTSRTTGRNAPSYFGMEVASSRVCFIVDKSGSMSEKNADGVRRFKSAKTELIKVIDKLPKGAYFNIVFFGTDYDMWQKRIVLGTPKVRADAKRYVTNTRLAGSTNLFDPLENAIKDRNVDTIYLLSDGAPSAGKYTQPNDILREIQRLNAGRRVVVHTIAFGTKSNLLKKLAAVTRGRYVERD